MKNNLINELTDTKTKVETKYDEFSKSSQQEM
jgi:hypothetical protein